MHLDHHWLYACLHGQVCHTTALYIFIFFPNKSMFCVQTSVEQKKIKHSLTWWQCGIHLWRLYIDIDLYGYSSKVRSPWTAHPTIMQLVMLLCKLCSMVWSKLHVQVRRTNLHLHFMSDMKWLFACATACMFEYCVRLLMLYKDKMLKDTPLRT